MNTDSRQWSALYMQEPVMPGGGEFKRDWVQYYDDTPDEISPTTNRYILVDPASGRRKDRDNDYTSMWVVGLGQDGNYYVLDMVRDKLTLTERGRELIRLHRKWKPMEVRYEHVGMQADIEYMRELQRQQTYRFAITEVKATVEKDTRIRRLIPLFEHRKVSFPTSMHRTMHDGITRNMVEQFVEEELLAFPGSKHDDALDALARIVEPDLSLVWPRAFEDDREQRQRYEAKRRTAGAWAAV